MKRHPSGWVTETIAELAKSPQFKANLLVLKRIAARSLKAPVEHHIEGTDSPPERLSSITKGFPCPSIDQ